MLFSDNHFFLNGEMTKFTEESAVILKVLADNRRLNIFDLEKYTPLDSTLLLQMYDWYVAGYLYFET